VGNTIATSDSSGPSLLVKYSNMAAPLAVHKLRSYETGTLGERSKSKIIKKKGKKV